MKAVAYVTLALLIGAVAMWILERARADRAEAAVVAWHARANSVSEQSDSVVRLARDSVRLALAERDSAIELAGAVQSRVDTLRIRVRDVQLLPVPDTCAELVRVRDMLLARYDSAYVAAHRAHQYQLRATMRALRSYTMVAIAYDSVRTVLAERPKPRSQWLPRIVVGPSAGLSSDLRPYTGVAITAGWEIPLERLLPW